MHFDRERELPAPWCPFVARSWFKILLTAMFIKTYDWDPSKQDRLYDKSLGPSKLTLTRLNKLIHLFDSMLPYQTVNKNIKLYKTKLYNASINNQSSINLNSTQHSCYIIVKHSCHSTLVSKLINTLYYIYIINLVPLALVFLNIDYYIALLPVVQPYYCLIPGIYQYH